MVFCKIVNGNEMLFHIDEIARLRIEVFRDFPYLYDGDTEYEKKYLRPYIDSNRSVCVLVFDGKKVVGASTCIPLDDENEVFKKPFKRHGENIDRIFYFGESVLQKEYRGQGLGVEFFRLRENAALSYPHIRKAVFCAVERPMDHPLKPRDYVPLDSFWQKRGYRKREELFTHLSWQDIDKTFEDHKKMVFWEKELIKS
jgi:GNAT superfamily N-acetyltransferase